jgi:hypothetical protein
VNCSFLVDERGRRNAPALSCPRYAPADRMVVRTRLTSLKGREQELADPTHPRKLCENCGAENYPQSTFCGSCGAPMASPAGDSADRSHAGASDPGKRSSPLGELSVDRLRSLSADPTREALRWAACSPSEWRSFEAFARPQLDAMSLIFLAFWFHTQAPPYQ